MDKLKPYIIDSKDGSYKICSYCHSKKEFLEEQRQKGYLNELNKSSLRIDTEQLNWDLKHPITNYNGY